MIVTSHQLSNSNRSFDFIKLPPNHTAVSAFLFSPMPVSKTTTTTTTTTVDMAATTNLTNQEADNQNPFAPILGFFSNLLKGFKLPPLPFLPPPQHQLTDDPATAGKPTSGVVSYPRRELGPLKAEGIQVPETQLLVVWQAYAVGSMLFLRWAWVLWNERRSRKPNDGPPPTIE